MRLQDERGELSLMWCVVLVVLVMGGLMVGLFSMRYERNFFAEGWSRFQQQTGIGQTLQQTQKAASVAVKPEAATVKKCIVDGVVTYSDVECSVKDPTTRKVELRDSRGIEPPKAPPAAAPQENKAANFKDKIIEQASQR